jgi:hypothetical protein
MVELKYVAAKPDEVIHVAKAAGIVQHELRSALRKKFAGEDTLRNAGARGITAARRASDVGRHHVGVHITSLVIAIYRVKVRCNDHRRYRAPATKSQWALAHSIVRVFCF